MNVVCVNLAGVTTFWVQRIVPARYWEASRARKATRTAAILWSSLLLALVVWVVFQTHPR